MAVPTRAWNSAHALPRTVGGLLSAAGALAAFYVILYFYAPPSALARLPALYFLWEAVLLTVAWRLIYLFVLGRGAFTRRAVIVGDGTRAKAAREFLQREARDTVVVGFVSDVKAKPLAERRKLADAMRAQSRAANANKPSNIMDVAESAVADIVSQHEAAALIHGHTHRPGIHAIGKAATRYVLGDWNRCGWLLRFDGSFSLLRFPLADHCEI